MMNNMKLMNDMELDQITGGYLDTNGKPSEAEIEAVEKMFDGIYDALCEGYSLLKYILFR